LILYWIISIPEKIDKWINAPTKTKNIIKDIFSELVKDKSFINQVVKIADTNDNIDTSATAKIVKLPNVQRIIKKYQKENSNMDVVDIENKLKQIFLDTWGDKSIINQALEKVKNDIKK
jgi:hypothetical protein